MGVETVDGGFNPSLIGQIENLPALDSLYDRAVLESTPPNRTRRLGISALAGSLTQYEVALQNTEELDIATQDELVEVISQGLAAERGLESQPLSEEMVAEALLGQNAQQQLALAFAGRVVNIAHWNSNRIGKWDSAFLQDTMQVGMLTLVESIVSYAKLPAERRHAFWPYAQAAINRKIGEATREELLGKRIEKRAETNDLGRFLLARKNFIEQHGRMPSDEEAATTLGIAREHAYNLRMWATPTRPAFDGESPFDVLEHESGEPGNNDVEILIERALEFLPQYQQRMMRMRFGIGGEPVMTTGEIARKLGANESAVSNAFSRDLATIKDIILGLQSESIDYEEMRIKKNVRNAMTLLHFAGVPMSETARLPELRQLAASRINQVVKDERERRVIYGLYGLEAGRNTHQELAAELGISKSHVRNVEGRVLERLKTDSTES